MAFGSEAKKKWHLTGAMSFLNELMGQYKTAGSNLEATLTKDAEDIVSGGGRKKRKNLRKANSFLHKLQIRKYKFENIIRAMNSIKHFCNACSI